MTHPFAGYHFVLCEDLFITARSICGFEGWPGGRRPNDTLGAQEPHYAASLEDCASRDLWPARSHRTDLRVGVGLIPVGITTE